MSGLRPELANGGFDLRVKLAPMDRSGGNDCHILIMLHRTNCAIRNGRLGHRRAGQVRNDDFARFSREIGGYKLIARGML